LCRAVHRVAPHSPAADVLAGLSIDAFCALDELTAAEEAARSAAPGVYSRTSRIRLRIRLGDLDRAAAECRRIIADSGAPLDHRSEALLLGTWARLEAGRDIESARSLAVAGIATRNRLRRVLTTVPRAVLDAVARHLPEAERAAFDDAVGGLPLIAASMPRPNLTARESVVLAALVAYPRVADLADALFVSTNTVKSQLRSIYRKLGARSRQDALDRARRLNLLPAIDA